MPDKGSYWDDWPARRYARRGILRVVAGGAGVGLTALAGCARQSSKGGSGSTGASSNPSGNGAQGQPKPGGAFTAKASGNPASFDPQRTFSYFTAGAVSNVMSRLFQFKSGPDPKISENHDVDPDLAVSAESPDGVTWTIKLHPGANFQNTPPVNGHAVEVEDIRATFQRALDPKNPTRGQLSMIDPSQIQAPAKDTLVFRLASPYAAFAEKLASPSYSWIYPREALAGQYDPAKQVIGSGPFTLDSYTPDVAVVYKKNPSWFEQGRPYIDTLRSPIIADSGQELAQFSAGNLDTISPIANAVATVKNSNPKLTRIKSRQMGGRALYFQLGDPSSPFQDIRVRRAVSLAVDRDALVQSMLNGEGAMQFVVPLAMGKWALTLDQLDPSDAQYYKYDPQQAKKLLADAGATNLDIKFIYPTNYLGPDFERYGQAVFNMLNSNLGWKMTLSTIDYQADFLGKGIRSGNYPRDTIIFSGISVDTEVDEYIYNYFYSQSDTNQERLKDPDLDAKMDKARTVVNADERLKAYLDIQKYMASKIYSVGFPYGYSYRFVQPWVQNYCYTSTYGSGSETSAKLWIQK